MSSMKGTVGLGVVVVVVVDDCVVGWVVDWVVEGVVGGRVMLIVVERFVVVRVVGGLVVVVLSSVLNVLEISGSSAGADETRIQLSGSNSERKML